METEYSLEDIHKEFISRGFKLKINFKNIFLNCSLNNHKFRLSTLHSVLFEKKINFKNIIDNPKALWKYNGDQFFYNIDFDFIKKNQELPWNWANLSKIVPFKIILNNLDYPWIWYYITTNKTVTFEDIHENKNLPWNRDFSFNSYLFIDDFYSLGEKFNLRDACKIMNVLNYEKYFNYIKFNNYFEGMCYNMNIPVSYIINFILKQKKKFLTLTMLFLLIHRSDITFEHLDILKHEFELYERVNFYDYINIKSLSYNHICKLETIKRTKKIWFGGYLQCVMQPGWYFTNCRDIYEIKTDEFSSEYYKENCPPVNFRGEWTRYDYSASNEASAS